MGLKIDYELERVPDMDLIKVKGFSALVDYRVLIYRKEDLPLVTAAIEQALENFRVIGFYDKGKPETGSPERRPGAPITGVGGTETDPTQG